MAKRYKLKENRHLKIKKRSIFYFAITFLYLAFVLSATVYSQTAYVDNLPEVTLTAPNPQEIEYVFRREFKAESGLLIYKSSTENVIPSDIIEIGCKAEIDLGTKKVSGEVKEATLESDNFRIVVSFNEKISDGETVEVEIIGKPKEFQRVVPVSAISFDEMGLPVLNSVVQQDGPWGKMYVIKQESLMFYWPSDGGAEYAVIPPDVAKGVPVVDTINADFLYNDMEVRIVG